MISARRRVLLMAGMACASGMAWALKPTLKIADQRPRIDLEKIFPRQFGDWKEASFASLAVVDPQQREMLDKIYNQTLARTYVNERNYAIMLSVAYGSDQSDALQLHKPEVCYPAQGFEVLARRSATIKLPIGAIEATRLVTALGSRHEPVTYWIVVGDRIVRGGLQKKLVEMSFGLGGKIPDGMLVRISSIDRDAEKAFQWHEDFAESLVGAVAASDRRHVVGAIAAG